MKSIFRFCTIVGMAGLLLTALGLVLSPQRALASYLLAFTYWAGISVAAIILLAVFHAARARWMVLQRRRLEVLGLTSLALVPLFIPIVLGAAHLFPWIQAPAHLTAHERHLLHHKAPYLNLPFFTVRAAIYFAVWIAVSHLLHRWSARQDAQPDIQLTVWQRRLGAGSLPALALTMTFASVDWLMSLHPTWQSTIFGVYYFAGSFVACIAVMTVLTSASMVDAREDPPVPEGHLHNWGKLLLAFVAFWAYIAFSQYMLIWIANLPEEAPWYMLRTQTGWRAVGIFLIVGHFAAPFAVLLSRRVKFRPAALSAVAGWVLFAHFVDLYWVVMPAFHAAGPSPSWTDLTAMAGIGGALASHFVWRLRAHPLVPRGDPFLADSVGYVPP